MTIIAIQKEGFKMNYYINYHPNTGISIKTHRGPGYINGDIGDVAMAMMNEDECVCCSLDNETKDCLTDASYWNCCSVSKEIIDELNNIVMDHQAEMYNKKHGLVTDIEKAFMRF